MSLVKVAASLWRELHELNKDFISVTNLITFLGYGYESRYQMFNKKDKPESEYLTKCLEHGHTWEPVCVKFLQDELGDEFFIFQRAISVVDGQVLGTPDAFVIDRLTGELGILEIKCPFGTKFGRFDQEDLIKGPSWFDLEKNHKHWIQVQLYLLMLKSYGTTFGLLAYFYPRAGPNGEPVCSISRFDRDPDLPNTLDLEVNLRMYFEDYLNRAVVKRERKPTRSIDRQYILSRGIVQKWMLP